MRAFVCCAVWSCHLWFAVALHALCQAIWARTAVGPRCPRVAGGARSRADRLPWIHQLVKDLQGKITTQHRIGLIGVGRRVPGPGVYRRLGLRAGVGRRVHRPGVYHLRAGLGTPLPSEYAGVASWGGAAEMRAACALA